MNNVNIDREIFNQIEKQVINHYPYECCGVLIGKRDEAKIDEIIPAKNNASRIALNGYFEIEPLFLYRVEIEAESKGSEVIGFYHSHPDKKAIPSKEDEKHMIPDNIYIIVSVTDNGINEFKAFCKNNPEEKIQVLSINIRGSCQCS